MRHATNEKSCSGTSIEVQAKRQRVRNTAKTIDENKSPADTMLNNNVPVRFLFAS